MPRHRFVSLPIMFVTFLVFLNGCVEKKKTGFDLMKSLQENMIYSNKRINSTAQDKLHQLEHKTVERYLTESANVWFPKATIISNAANDVLDYIETLKATLQQSIEKNNTSKTVTTIFENEKVADSLQKKLYYFKGKVLQKE
jgi:hypothetical protein